ncbi:MAG: anthranilate synthase component I family protein, partial [Bacteroidetes bacterium]|nr:anthranilate synthase component I family protein [Bacteroidota bacterium]
MKKIKFKTISTKQLADTITPVGMYSKIRDKYPNSLLLESSDYHSKEESFTFIAVEPIVTLKADDNVFTYSYKDKEIDSKKINRNFYRIFQDYSKTIDVDCDAAIKAYNGFYGYVSYNGIQYFETIKLNAKKAASEIP